MTDEFEITISEPDAVSAQFIAHGLDLSFIRRLPEDQIMALARLMARAAERSYRRGFQQGAHIAQTRPADMPDDIHAWRYGTTTDLSPWADCPRGETSLSRLHMENDCLRSIGLPSSRLADEYEIFVWPPKALQ